MNRGVDNFVGEFIAASTAAGVVSVQTIVSKQLHHGYVPPSFYLITMVTAVLSFIPVALLLRRSRTGGPHRLLPNTLVTTFVGCALFVLLRLLPAIVAGFYNPLFRANTTLTEYLVRELPFMATAIVALILITLPFVGVAYFVATWIQEKYQRDS